MDGVTRQVPCLLVRHNLQVVRVERPAAALGATAPHAGGGPQIDELEGVEVAAQ